MKRKVVTDAAVKWPYWNQKPWCKIQSFFRSSAFENNARNRQLAILIFLWPWSLGPFHHFCSSFLTMTLFEGERDVSLYKVQEIGSGMIGWLVGLILYASAGSECTKYYARAQGRTLLEWSLEMALLFLGIFYLTFFPDIF